MLRVVKTVPACGRDVTVKELTVGEIRAWLAGVTDRVAGGDIVSVALLDDTGVSLDDLSRMSDLTAEEIDAAAPSELAAVIEKIKEVNRDFFSLRAKLERLGQAVMATPEASAPSAD